MVVLAVTTLISRIRAPWRLDVTNDEAHHHLESWKNRYRTDDIYPVFLERLRRLDRLTESQMELVEKVYHSGPLAQRGLLVLVDPQPPLYPILAESLEALSHSSLIVLRLPSVIASILTVLLVFQIGNELRGHALGLWMAGLLSMDSMAQLFAGIGRPYALSQMALALFLRTFVREMKTPSATPARLCLAALLAQGLQWMTWAIVGPLLLMSFAKRLQKGATIRSLLKSTWWYPAISILLLVEMMIQLQNPTVSGQAEGLGIAKLAGQFLAANPFYHLAFFGAAGSWLGASLFVGGVLLGGILLIRRYPASTYLRASLLLALVVSVCAPAFIGSSHRFMMTYAFLPILLCAMGLSWFLPERQSAVTLLSMVALMFGITVIKERDPYGSGWFCGPRYSTAASDLDKALEQHGVWAAYPYFHSSPLYGYADLPTPSMPQDLDGLRRFIASRPTDTPCLVLVEGSEAYQLPEICEGQIIGEYAWIRLIQIPSRTTVHKLAPNANETPSSVAPGR